MKNNTFGKLVLKGIVFFLPLIVLLYCYAKVDPFKVIRRYDTYVNDPVNLNQSYINWQTFLNNKDTIPYDSFILGNSCCMAYHTEDWAPYLGNCSPIILYGNAESLVAMTKKVEGLDRHGVPIKNVLMLMDHGTLSKIYPILTYRRVLHPDLSGESYLQFQSKFLVGFFTPSFLIPYLEYQLTGKVKPSMSGIIGHDPTRRNLLTNDFYNPREKKIAEMGEGYWVKNKKKFKLPSDLPSVYYPIIGKKQLAMLNRMHDIFKKHNTNYKIVINPELNKIRFSSEDLKVIQDIFGKDRVFDFSGENSITSDYHNFYEKTHYRSMVGRQIIKEIYSTQNSGNLATNSNSSENQEEKDI